LVNKRAYDPYVVAKIKKADGITTLIFCSVKVNKM